MLGDGHGRRRELDHFARPLRGAPRQRCATVRTAGERMVHPGGRRHSAPACSLRPLAADSVRGNWCWTILVARHLLTNSGRWGGWLLPAQGGVLGRQRPKLLGQEHDRLPDLGDLLLLPRIPLGQVQGDDIVFGGVKEIDHALTIELRCLPGNPISSTLNTYHTAHKFDMA